MESLTQICRSHFLAAFVPENKTPSEAQNSGEAENKVKAVNVDVNDVSRGSRGRGADSIDSMVKVTGLITLASQSLTNSGLLVIFCFVTNPLMRLGHKD